MQHGVNISVPKTLEQKELWFDAEQKRVDALLLSVLVDFFADLYLFVRVVSSLGLSTNANIGLAYLKEIEKSFIRIGKQNTLGFATSLRKKG